MSANINIREATESDIDFIFWIMKTAARSGQELGFIDKLFPGEEEKNFSFIKEMILSDIKSLFHYSNFILAEENGVPVAGMSGYYTPEIHSEHFRECFAKTQEKFGLSEEEREDMTANLAVFVGCFPGLLENAWVVEWVAAKPEYRGKGIVRKLLHSIINYGIENTDCEVVQIAVAKGNTPAVNAYKGIGFESYDEKVSKEFEQEFGYPGMERLVINKESFSNYS
ncbi:MAG: N-acetyltransferase [Gammaproteobacteria bacterium]|nr:MAG: N-acetyltransferase [Gammaproteobacteria bacterium]